MLTFQYLAKFQKMLGYSMKEGHGTDRCWGYSRNTVYSHPWGVFGVFGVLYNTPHFVRTRNRIDQK